MIESQDPRCYACGAAISTVDTTQWIIALSFRDVSDNLVRYDFTVADDSHMAIGYLNGMYHRGFFAREDAEHGYMHVIPISRVVHVLVTSAGRENV